jgi:hypothetical protein
MVLFTKVYGELSLRIQQSLRRCYLTLLNQKVALVQPQPEETFHGVPRRVKTSEAAAGPRRRLF